MSVARRTARRAVAALAATLSLSVVAAPAIDVAPLPLGIEKVAASADECAVWRRELAFARSVEAHDATAFASLLHAGAVFNAGTADAVRGRDAVAADWTEIVRGDEVVLRWRPGIVQIGGAASIALSRGPYILQVVRNGETVFRVGHYQTVWSRDPATAQWRVLYDGGASTPIVMADRAAAERWVEAQKMSDCAAA